MSDSLLRPPLASLVAYYQDSGSIQLASFSTDIDKQIFIRFIRGKGGEPRGDWYRLPTMNDWIAVRNEASKTGIVWNLQQFNL